MSLIFFFNNQGKNCEKIIEKRGETRKNKRYKSFLNSQTEKSLLFFVKEQIKKNVCYETFKIQKKQNQTKPIQLDYPSGNSSLNQNSLNQLAYFVPVNINHQKNLHF